MNRNRHRRRWSGTSTIEVVVAFTLLTSVLSLSLPLVIRHGRLLIAARQYRLAVDELSNQLERLTALPEAEVEAVVLGLAPSGFTTDRLPGVQLSGTLEPSDFGRRLTLRIIWDEPNRREAPVEMTAWIIPEPSRPSEQPNKENPR